MKSFKQKETEQEVQQGVGQCHRENDASAERSLRSSCKIWKDEKIREKARERSADGENS